MNIFSSRPNMTGIAAACILSGGLIAAAIIDSHKPVAVVGGSHAPFATGAARSEPPLSQESVASQAAAQLLAAPKLHGLPYKGSACDLIGAKTTLVQYLPATDELSLTFDLKWKTGSSAINRDADSSVTTHVWSGGNAAPPDTGTLTLSNDGYGHYFGTFDPDHSESGTPYITVTVR